MPKQLPTTSTSSESEDNSKITMSAAVTDIVKINSKALEPSELKRLDKLEKEAISGHVIVSKGRKFKAARRRIRGCPNGGSSFADLAYLARVVSSSNRWS